LRAAVLVCMIADREVANVVALHEAERDW
jgi:hypothetical protein